MNNGPRFDVYITHPCEDDFAVTMIGMNVPVIVAESLAGVDSDDFRMSILHTGWCGTTPGWTNGYPIVVVPFKDHLSREQLEFIVEQV